MLSQVFVCANANLVALASNCRLGDLEKQKQTDDNKVVYWLFGRVLSAESQPERGYLLNKLLPQ